MATIFGPAGVCDRAREEKVKTTVQFLDFVKNNSLDAFEYQCGRGVNIGEEMAILVGEAARQRGITLSIHAPYYISLASAEEQKRINSIDYILQSARAAKAMGAQRIVVHPGGIGKMQRQEAAALAKQTLAAAVRALDENGLGDITVCPEVMGKINQLGHLEEIIDFCSLDERLIPCVDFGHYNSYTQGSLKTAADFENVFDTLKNGIGEERTNKLHIHFSKIEYSKGGEVRHLTFEDSTFGPDPEILVNILAKECCNAVVICESAGTQTDDAAFMKKLYEGAQK